RRGATGRPAPSCAHRRHHRHPESEIPAEPTEIGARPGVNARIEDNEDPGHERRAEQERTQLEVPRRHAWAVRVPARTPRLETRNGTTKFRPMFTAVPPFVWPCRIRSPSLMIDRMQPTTSAIVSVRRRLDRLPQVLS